MNEYLQIENIKVQIRRKRIKNLYISVSSATGEVSISAPLKYPISLIQKFLAAKLKWIQKNKTEISLRPVPVKNNFNDGENILFFGRQYKLKVYDYGKSPKVFAAFDSVDLYIGAGASVEDKLIAINVFYKEQLEKKVIPIAAKWEEKLAIRTESNPVKFGLEKIKNSIGKHIISSSLDDEKVLLMRPVRLEFKMMKSKWGSCNISDKKITLNIELAKKSLRCVEYVTAHELLHLKERKHNKRFKQYMQKAFPDWKNLESELKIL